MTKEKFLKAVTEDLERKETEFESMIKSRAVGVETLAYQKGYLDCLRNINWSWNDGMIQGLANQNKIVITTKGNEVTARLYDGKKVIKTATAKCSPDDEFDFTTGAKIAFERLTKAEKEKPTYYNGKAVCTGIGYVKADGFTTGKIYKFVDGKCIDDFGTQSPVEAVRTLEEFQNVIGNKFIELVEE